MPQPPYDADKDHAHPFSESFLEHRLQEITPSILFAKKRNEHKYIINQHDCQQIPCHRICQNTCESTQFSLHDTGDNLT